MKSCTTPSGTTIREKDRIKEKDSGSVYRVHAIGGLLGNEMICFSSKKLNITGGINVKKFDDAFEVMPAKMDARK